MTLDSPKWAMIECCSSSNITNYHEEISFDRFSKGLSEIPDTNVLLMFQLLRLIFCVYFNGNYIPIQTYRVSLDLAASSARVQIKLI